jgi:signal transduction histidine kinase
MLSNREALSRASHELRTPLQTILGFSQLLALDSLNDSQRHSVEQIIAGGRHLLGLIEDLLDLSRVGELSIGPVDVGAEITHAVELCRPLAAERSLTVNLELPEQPLLALADRRRLTQILLNLISNGIKYNRPGGSLTLRAAPDPDLEATLRIDVIDTGLGLSAPEIDRLFVPFERLDAGRRGIDGNGLGLAVSRTLAEAMDGTVEVASEPGGGSVFTLRLVAGQVEDVERAGRVVVVGVADGEDDPAADHDRAVPVATAGW